MKREGLAASSSAQASRPSIAARTRTAADKPSPLVSHHAQHAATSRQVPDNPTPLVSTVASSSPRPRILPRDREPTSVADAGPGSRKSHDLVPLAPRLRYRMRAVGCAARITIA